MNARAGVVTSQVVWLASLPVTALPYEHPLKGAAAGFVVAAFASFLPDLDHPNSTVGRYFPRWVRWLMGGHRMGAHSIAMVAGAWWLTGYLLANPIIANAVAVGMSSHVILDMLTIQGVGLLYPFTRRRFRLASMTTGSAGEDVFVLIMKCVGGVVFVGYAYLFGGF